MAASLSSIVPNPSHHSEVKLYRLKEYVDAFLKSDADWFDRHLATDFRCILPSGEIIDRAAFLASSAQPVAMAAFTVEDVTVQFEGDTAIVQARTVYTRHDGSSGQSRYTDIWARRPLADAHCADHCRRTRVVITACASLGRP